MGAVRVLAIMPAIPPAKKSKKSKQCLVYFCCDIRTTNKYSWKKQFYIIYPCRISLSNSQTAQGKCTKNTVENIDHAEIRKPLYQVSVFSGNLDLPSVSSLERLIILTQRSQDISAVLPYTISSILLFLANISQFSPFWKMSISCFDVIRQSRITISRSYDVVNLSCSSFVWRSFWIAAIRDKVLAVENEHLEQFQQPFIQLRYLSLYYLAIFISFWWSLVCLYSSQLAALIQLLLLKESRLSILCLMRPIQSQITSSTSSSIQCNRPFLRDQIILVRSLQRKRQKWIYDISIFDVALLSNFLSPSLVCVRGCGAVNQGFSLEILSSFLNSSRVTDGLYLCS